MPLSTVIFDVFGTLIINPPHRTNPYLRLAKAGLDLRQAMTRNVSLDTFAEELGVAHLRPQLQQELAQELRIYRLFGDVLESLLRLRASRIRIGVCSNLAFEYGPIVRELLPELDAYTLSFEVGAAKPEPEIYQTACESLGCEPQEVLFIGDSRRADFDGPRDFGMQACMIDRINGQRLTDIIIPFIPSF